jgi:hypothetical protein
MDTKELLLLATILQGGAAAALESLELQHNKRKIDRQLPKSTLRTFRHDEAIACIKREYPRTPLVSAELQLMFRLSRGQFRVLMEEDAMVANIRFFISTIRGALDKSSLAVHLLLLLKTLEMEFLPTHSSITSRCLHSMQGTVERNLTR